MNCENWCVGLLKVLYLFPMTLGPKIKDLRLRKLQCITKTAARGILLGFAPATWHVAQRAKVYIVYSWIIKLYIYLTRRRLTRTCGSSKTINGRQEPQSMRILHGNWNISFFPCWMLKSLSYAFRHTTATTVWLKQICQKISTETYGSSDGEHKFPQNIWLSAKPTPNKTVLY